MPDTISYLPADHNNTLHPPVHCHQSVPVQNTSAPHPVDSDVPVPHQVHNKCHYPWFLPNVLHPDFPDIAMPDSVTAPHVHNHSAALLLLPVPSVQSYTDQKSDLLHLPMDGRNDS